MMRTLRKISLYAATVWLGIQIAGGLIMQAGEIAGILFHIISWLGLIIWGILFLTHTKILTRLQTILLCTLLLSVAINQFLIAPVIDALKYGYEDWLLSLLGGSFGMWHGISSIVFMATALLSTALSWQLSSCKNTV
ncbi:DUF4149 domain-containing protein [Neisseria sp. Marseille-Q6792]|uniref:DUF4149 domain-containing protein n=1 Tax=Neisseria sp. Marseille-Q6792 TaxID=2937985 RepID=UPI002023C13F|nr:DUF4149 domain-containing protein [Neisseria sp. Marseille-Q6792]